VFEIFFVQSLKLMLANSRIAAKWLLHNRHCFNGNIDVPYLTTASEDDTSKFIKRITGEGAKYEDYKDDLLFDFDDGKDAKLFLQLMGRGLRLRINCAVNGHDYIQTSSHNLCDNDM
jgi:hypothetical protein